MTRSLRLLEVRRQPNIQRAENRAARLYPRSRGFQTAYVKGWRARRAKRAPGACPYSAGPEGWTWAWRSAWMQGYFEGDQT